MLSPSERIFRELVKLGGSADQVAKRLAELGCYGTPADESYCPLTCWAKYYQGVCSKTNKGIMFVETEDGTVAVGMPNACCHFVENFDNLEYEDLIMDDNDDSTFYKMRVVANGN